MWGAGVSWVPRLGCSRSDSVVARDLCGYKSNLEAPASGFATSISFFLNLELGNLQRGWAFGPGLVVVHLEGFDPGSE